ncbi:MAG TPA: hypothetical protein VFN24_02990 [Microbacterium sp.]|nr:hypothetical protein [Microbacterium sp.]
MDDTLTDELRTLRARAYGPAADIHDDPAALERLRQLESWGRTPPRPPDPASSPPAADAGAPNPETADRTPASPPPASPAPAVAPAPPTRRWGRGRLLLVWIATLVAAGLAGAAAASLMPRSESAPLATLAATQDASWPDFVLGDRPEGAVLFAEHLGVQMIAVPQEVQGGSSVCLYAMSARDLPRGAFAVGCGAGPFAPTLTSVVGSDWPAEMLERFPVGSAVQYVLAGDRVLVYAALPGSAPEPTP